MVRKIFIFKIIFLFLFIIVSKSFGVTIDEVLKSNPQFNSSTIAISVKNADTNKILYQKNSEILIHPASTLKLITSSAIFNYLGEKYRFYTRIYKNKNDFYLKIGADPLFSYSDMQSLINQYQSKNNGIIKNIIIDDKIIDKISYGVGWQWDDNTSIYFPQISPYIINNNIFLIKAKINEDKNIVLEHAVEYSEPVINNLKVGEKNSINITRNIFNPHKHILLEGTINKSQIIKIPAINPELLFNNVLGYILIQNHIPFNSKFKYDYLPRFCALEAEISHSIIDVLKEINQNSNNLAAEILIKHAAAVKSETTGTTKEGLDIVKNFYLDNDINLKNITMVDASGASMNDYVTADFMTSALTTIKNSTNFEIIKNSMSTPTKGTYKGRTPKLNGNIYVKTGTLANTSSVVGYLKTITGKNLVFAIMIDNMPKHLNSKEFENSLLYAIYQM